MSGLSRYKYTTVPVATAALAGGSRLMGLCIHGGSANSSVEVKDAASDTGTVLFSAAALAATSVFFDFTEMGGIAFSTGIFVKPAGTACIVYVWTE